LPVVAEGRYLVRSRWRRWWRGSFLLSLTLNLLEPTSYQAVAFSSMEKKEAWRRLGHGDRKPAGAAA
jgi:hypothetical protein